MEEKKTRPELIPPFSLEEYTKVLTNGASKHGDWKWREGRKWSEVLSSLKRCLSKFERGEDFDEEGMYLTAKIMFHAAALTEYYKLYPQGDNRLHPYLNHPRIGLDIDEIIADFNSSWMKKFNIVDEPNWWFFDNKMQERFDELKQNNELDDFYLNLQPKIKPEDIPFEPFCYVTSRPISTEITSQWLQKYNFPAVPVYTVPPNTTKVNILKQIGIDIFVEDRYDNFVELNKAGICCYLMDTPHNKRYDVKYKRIYSLKDLKY